MEYTFSWPASPGRYNAILPVFIPFLGCPQRCIFCAQHLQSGTNVIQAKNAVTLLYQHLLQRKEQGLPPAEIGFFGGTFTALPAEDMALCLDFTSQAKSSGLISKARCSTRPDALRCPILLKKMQQAGFTTIEIGIQSFNTPSLKKAKRHYTGAIALEACTTVREAGLTLGVQLMPGMPGVTPRIFLQDVETALQHGARELRFYPCLVLKGTELARMWEEGDFTPWSMEETLPALAEGWLMAQDATARVLRMGLAPEPGLEDHILAGPRHPALGALVQGLALLQRTREKTKGNKLACITLPRHCQGFFWGDKGNLAADWADLGITRANTRWHKEDSVSIMSADKADAALPPLGG